MSESDLDGAAGEELAAISPVANRRDAALHFAGRMFQEDPLLEAELSEQIADFVAAHKIIHGFGSLACGADIVVAETLLRLGREVSIVLAAPADAFKSHSVAPGGPGWAPRFDSVLSKASHVLSLGDSKFATLNTAFSLTTTVAIGQALLFAARNDCELQQLIVTSGAPRSETAGSNADQAQWQSLHLPSATLNAGPIERPGATAEPSRCQPVEANPVATVFLRMAGDDAGSGQPGDWRCQQFTDQLSIDSLIKRPTILAGGSGTDALDMLNRNLDELPVEIRRNLIAVVDFGLAASELPAPAQLADWLGAQFRATADIASSLAAPGTYLTETMAAVLALNKRNGQMLDFAISATVQVGADPRVLYRLTGN